VIRYRPSIVSATQQAYGISGEKEPSLTGAGRPFTELTTRGGPSSRISSVKGVAAMEKQTKRGIGGIWTRLAVVGGLAFIELLLSLGHLPLLVLD